MNVEEMYRFFENCFPTSLEQRLIGVEHEYPAVFSNGEGITFEVVDAVYQKLAERGWHLEQDGSTGKTVNAELPYKLSDGTQSSHIITTDAGVHTIEIGLAPLPTIQEADRELKTLVALVQELLAEHDATLLGYGVQPIASPDSKYLAPRGRYRFLQEDFDRGIAFTNSLELHASPDGQYSGHIPYNYGIYTLSAAGQTHIDLTAAEAVPVMNALNSTSGLRIALFANSPIWQGRVSRYKALRELFWEWGWTIRTQQTGFAPYFEDLRHYLNNLLRFRGFMIHRDHTYYRLDMSRPVRDFIVSDSHRAEAINGEWVDMSPRLEDIHFFCGTAWYTARLQSKFATIEDRCPCNQPPEAHLGTTALMAGLIENNQKLVELAERIPHDQWLDVRLAACKSGMQASYPYLNIPELVDEMLAIAMEGLEMRGHGEEIYLQPVMERAQQRRCPANDALDSFEAGGIDALIDRFTMQRYLDE